MKYSFQACLLASLLCSFVTAKEKPNILFLFSDDQCFETIGAYGMTDIETPHLDRLVEEGTVFSHAYNMGGWNGAICVASRHMLNTGAFVWHAQKLSGNLQNKKLPHPEWPDFQKEGLMWSQLMGEAGYDTYFTGKWHVRADPAKIFTVARNVRGGMPNQTKEGYNRPVQGQPDPWSPFDPKFEGFWKGGKHWSEVVADDAVDYLAMAEKSENPFFMYIAFNAPHDPRQAPKEFIEKYPLDRIAVPENFLPEYPYKMEIDNPPGLRDEKLAPFPRTKYAVQVHRQEYYAIITHMDEQIGRILDALEDSGEKDNTLIVFTSDHGLSVGSHGLIGKQSLFDHSIRVPFIMVGPGVETGRKIDEPIYLQDVMSTSLELAEVELPKHIQFQSLLPLLEGKPSKYRAIYGAYQKSQRSIVQDDWKLIAYPKVPKLLLFDLEKDPLEMNDLSGKEPEKVENLFKGLLELQKETGDSLSLKTSFPEMF